MDIFGYSDDIPDPPTCLITVLADNTIPDTAHNLNYHVPVKGIVCDTRKLSIIRVLETLETRGMYI